VVERDLAKVDVAGSTPVSRSIIAFPDLLFPPCDRPAVSFMQHDRVVDIFFRERYFIEQGRGTQVVRERSAKPLCVGSIPTRASKFANSCDSSL
jgi:hypothetical protein